MDCRALAWYGLSLAFTDLPLSLPEALKQALRVHVQHQAPDLPLTFFSILAWVFFLRFFVIIYLFVCLFVCLFIIFGCVRSSFLRKGFL